jgi:hypothetical protein
MLAYAAETERKQLTDKNSLLQKLKIDATKACEAYADVC